MPTLQVKGQEQLKRIRDVLEEKGNGPALKRRLSSAIRSEAGSITRDQRASLAAGLPKRGGADAEITGQSKLSVRVSAAAATVTITDSWPGHSMRAIEGGNLRHPLFGNRKHWYDTRIKSRLLYRPFLRHKRQVQLAIIREMDAVAQEIAKES